MTKHKKTSRKSRKRKVYGFFLHLVWLSFLVVFTTVFYFLILISVNYKSFPFITNTIESSINSALPQNTKIKISKSYLKFSPLRKIHVKFDDIKFITDGKKEVVLPKIEAEFSIYNLFFLKAIPSKVKIIGPTITIDKTAGSPQIALGSYSDIFAEQEYLKQLSAVFLSLTNSDVAIKSFIISDGTIIFKNQFGSRKILVESSEINMVFSQEGLNLITKNKISLDVESPDLFINGNCQFKKSSGLKCNADFSNFVPAEIASFSEQLQILKQIDTVLSGNINASIDENHQLSELLFTINANSGSFNYPQFFSKEIVFQNLSARGEFNNLLKTFRISNLDVNFDSAKLSMSVSIDNLLDKNQQSTDMQFTIHNVKTDELEKLWPVFLDEHNSRKWVLEHIRGGIVKDGYAKMLLKSKNGVDELDNINSEIIFSGLNLNYDRHFPPINNIDGIAAFTKHNMKIDITSGNVLNSKINIGSVIIPDFEARHLSLLINAKLSGAAVDTLKHIDYKSEFANRIEDYFNGTAETIIDVKIPIIHNLKLHDTFIKVNSGIKNFNNNYITKDSALLINTVKAVGNNQFNTDIDLTGANISLKQFGISKEKGIKSHIKTILSFDYEKHLWLKNLNWQQETNGWGKQITGDLLLELDPIAVASINLVNNNFGNNNFVLNYSANDNSRHLKLMGKRLDLQPLIANSSQIDFQPRNYRINDFEVQLNNLYLANNQHFRNINISLNCNQSLCKNGFAVANLSKDKNANIVISGAKDHSDLEGSIDDISLVAKGFDVSNQIIDGNAKIKAKIKSDGDKEVMEGELKINDGFTVLKNDVVEKIYNNSAFAKLKSKIASDNKIQFDNLKLDFVSDYSSVQIKTLIASSYLMGFTAKGKVDFQNNIINLKGLIIPGYAINRLFGIGKIPVLGSIIVGEEGGGIFAIRYDYTKKKSDLKGDFSINPASAVIPGGIRNVFDLF